MEPLQIATPDGLNISAQLWGNPSGPEILFIHGLMQSHMCWQPQVSDPGLAAAFRMVTFDLRGHGDSDKPLDRERYLGDRLWADDVQAVMDGAGLKRPVIVAWSYGGRVVTDYLRCHGQERVAGINLVAAAAKSGMDHAGPAIKSMAPVFSPELTTRIDGSRAFLRACFERPPPQDIFEVMLAYNMVVPPHVREACVDRAPNPGDLLPVLKMPVLASHGERDPFMLPSMARFVADTVPNARLSLYPGIGHSPFVEDAARFNRELTEFVRAANA